MRMLKRGISSHLLAYALVAVLVASVGVVTPGLTETFAGAATDSIYCTTGLDSRQPVLLVHGFNSGPDTWQDASRNQLARAGTATCIDVFDYADQSTNWVTDAKIGPALAIRISTLAAAFKAGGGSGKVIIVAHSMGGLATRCAASELCNGGLNSVGPLIAELISFGTPNNGSWLVGPGLHDVGRTVGSLLSARCYFSVNSSNDICRQIRNFGTSDATRAFKPDSKQLQDLPTLPPTVPVYALAGQVEIYSSFFGLNNVDLGDGGDTVVLEDSALVAAKKIDGIGGSQTINCGRIDITDFAQSAHSCWHSSETNDTRFLEAAAYQISLVENAGKTCGTATTKDSSGGPLSVEYARAAQSILAAACNHNYRALADLMDNSFDYGPGYQSGSPDAVVAAWKEEFPDGRNLDALARVLTMPPTFDQGGYTFRTGTTTATFARLYEHSPWTGFLYDASSSSSGSTDTSPASADSDACPTPAVLLAAMARAQPGTKITSISHVICSGAWAGAQADIDDGSEYGNASSALFKRSGSVWMYTAREAPCAQGIIPSSIRIVCDSN